MKTKIEIKPILQYCLIYFGILSTRGMLYFLNQDLFTYLILIASGIAAIRYSSVRNKNIFIGLFLLLCAIMSVFILSGGIGINRYLIWTSKILAAYCAVTIDGNNFGKRFLRVVMIIAYLSLFFWCLETFLPNIFQQIPFERYNIGWRNDFIGKLFYVSCLGHGRNIGIFVEPGIYTIVLTSAVYLQLYYSEYVNKDKKQMITRFIVLIFTIATAQSTTGYITILLLFLPILFNAPKNTRKIITSIIVLTIIGLVIDYKINGNNSLINTVVFGKLIDDNMQFDIAASTGLHRENALFGYLQAFLRNPFGMGYDNVGTFVFSVLGIPPALIAGGGLTYNLAATGLFTYAVLFMLIIYPAFKNKLSLQSFYSYLVLFIMASVTQSEVVYFVIVVLGYIKISYLESVEQN